MPFDENLEVNDTCKNGKKPQVTEHCNCNESSDKIEMTLSEYILLKASRDFWFCNFMLVVIAFIILDSSK